MYNSSLPHHKARPHILTHSIPFIHTLIIMDAYFCGLGHLYCHILTEHLLNPRLLLEAGSQYCAKQTQIPPLKVFIS